MNDANKNNESAPNLPVAATSPPAELQVGKFSGMWWVTLACLVLAIGLVWWSMPENGVGVTVRFPEGHGLQAEDQVLYRGIEVGYVDEVELNSDLSSVDVKLELKASAANLAREGTRFWIVRPQLSLSGITGLETAVGHKYVSLSPGPVDGSQAFVFEGLLEPPPQDVSSPGIEVVMRGDKRYSVSPGSTVTFRGVEVGRILSVNLSQDSRYVDVRAKIFEKYTQNLTTASRFWATSGINFDFSLSEGLKFDSESLASIAQGGVSFLTIASDGEPIVSGHVFKLFPRPDDQWMLAADSVSSTAIELGGVLKLQKRWQQKSLIGKRTKSALINGIPIKSLGGKKMVIVPISAAAFPGKAVDESRELVASTVDGTQVITCQEAGIAELESDSQLGNFQWPKLTGVKWLTIDDFRVPDEIESVLAVRANVEDSDITYLHYPIESAYLRNDWTVPQFDRDPDVWNGAPVLSSQDGKVIGIMIADEQLARIIPFRKDLFGF